MIGIVVIVKEKKKVLFHSELQKFDSIPERDKFTSTIRKAFKKKGISDKDIHAYTVTNEPQEMDEDTQVKGKKLYCPYCGQVNKFKQGQFDSKVCPVCGISERDFYIKKYNKLK